jgi:colanic acid/amylovoran biosynthesis glycosyltransferase
MHILILGIGDKIPTFILKRLVALDKQGMKLILETSNKNQEIIKREFSNTLFISKKKFELSRIDKMLIRFVTMFLNISTSFKLIKLSPHTRLISKLRWSYENFHLTQLKKVDIIHLQWISMGEHFSWLKQFYKAPIIGSARGSQVTIYPITRTGFIDSLHKSIQSLDYIHCVSEDICQICKERGATENQLFVNYNGTDLTQFSMKENIEYNFDQLELVSTGTLMWRKGYLYQLLILKKLIEKGVSVRLTIIGSGHEYESLLYTAETLGIGNNIILKGQLAHDEVKFTLHKSHIYLSTSIAEGLANSVMEASACGVVPVVFQCEGMSEVVNDGKTGYVVPFGDIDTMAARILHLYQRQSKLANMSKNARKKIENELNLDDCVKDMLVRYKSIIPHGST